MSSVTVVFKKRGKKGKKGKARAGLSALAAFPAPAPESDGPNYSENSEGRDPIKITMERMEKHGAMVQSSDSVVKQQAEASVECPDWCAYDDVYEKVSSTVQTRETDKGASSSDNRSKYISNLVSEAEKRKKRMERSKERMLQKRQNEEAGKYGSTESYITPAYKQKLLEERGEDGLLAHPSDVPLGGSAVATRTGSAPTAAQPASKGKSITIESLTAPENSASTSRVEPAVVVEPKENVRANKIAAATIRYHARKAQRDTQGVQF